MSRHDEYEYHRLSDLIHGLRTRGDLPPGIADPTRADVFVLQLVESMRRVRFFDIVSARGAGPTFADPSSAMFDPLKAIVHYRDLGNQDEAFWMAFLYVHFGKSRKWGWEYPRLIYGALGDGTRWTWDRVSNDIDGFCAWLSQHETELRAGPGAFGNHRKYESLSATSDVGTGAAVSSYVHWVLHFGSHAAVVAAASAACGGDDVMTFDYLTNAVEHAVTRFGRTASFDYVNLLSWMGLVPARAGSCHIDGSTGPARGARALLGGGQTAPAYEVTLADLCDYLAVPFDVMEDALCNWQKSPDHFTPFRG